MRIQCLFTRSFLTRYLYDELGERLGRLISIHIERCDDCRDRLRREALLRGRLRSFEVPGVAEGEWEDLFGAVLDRVGGVGEPTPPFRETISFRRHHGRARYVLIAAAVALLVVGAALRLLATSSSPQQTPIASYIQYHEAAVDGHVLLENHFWSSQGLPVSFTTSR